VSLVGLVLIAFGGLYLAVRAEEKRCVAQKKVVNPSRSTGQ